MPEVQAHTLTDRQTGVTTIQRLLSVATPRRVRVVLIAWGVLLALLTAYRLNLVVPDHTTLMQIRHDDVNAAIQQLNAGGAPLDVTPRLVGSPPLPYDNYPLPEGDDAGIYLYLPLIGHALGVDDALILLKWSYITLMSLLMLALPLILYELFGSLVVGALGPIVLFWRLAYLNDTDIYWISSWAILALLPLVLLVHRRWGRWSVFWLASVAVIASWASSIRSEAGLPIAIAAIAVVLVRGRTWRVRVGGSIALVLAYASISPGLIAGVKMLRNHEIHGTIAPESQTTPFHTLYIGLGYLPNRWGIAYDDGIAYAAVRKRYPKVQYLGAGYPRAIRTVYLDFVRAHPGFVARTYVEKSRAVLRDTLAPTWLTLLVLGGVLTAGAGRSRRRRLMLAFLPAFVLSFIPPVIAMPRPDYEGALITTMLLAGFFGVFWLVADAEEVIAAGGAGALIPTMRRLVSRDRVRRALRPLWAPWPLSVGVVGALVGLAVYAPSLPGTTGNAATGSFYRPGATPLVARAPAGRVVAFWRISGGLPPGWRAVGSVSVRPIDGVLAVTTSRGKYEYQLEGPSHLLAPGTYAVVATGRVTDGGLEVGALNADAQSWLATTHYWYAQRFDRKSMVTTFTLDRRTHVRAMLDNWAPQPHKSHWQLKTVRLVATG